MAKSTFEIYKNAGGNWSWRLKASNGKKVAAAGETFASEAAARRAAQTAKNHAGKAEVPAKEAGVKAVSRSAAKPAAKSARTTTPVAAKRSAAKPTPAKRTAAKPAARSTRSSGARTKK
jgi:uncharacterized protein YegP (UPF0339 family)